MTRSLPFDVSATVIACRVATLYRRIMKKSGDILHVSRSTVLKEPHRETHFHDVTGVEVIIAGSEKVVVPPELKKDKHDWTRANWAPSPLKMNRQELAARARIHPRPEPQRI